MSGLITVVVPVYKVEQYLDRCVESIINQTYRDIEVILVDDGSPDSCPQICDKWAYRDERVQVIHKQNAGLGMARNTGIENATGEYICFFDSDDYVRPEAIEKASDMAFARKADIVIFGYCLIDRDGAQEKTVIPKVEREFYCGDAVRTIFLPELIALNPRTGVSANLLMSAWTSMYSMELIRKNKWHFVSERKIIAEDVYSLLDLYQYVDKVAVLKNALYCHCKNEHSLSRSYKPDRYERIKEFYTESINLCKAAGYDDEVAFRMKDPFLGFTIAAMKQIMTAELSLSQKKIFIKQILDDDLLNNISKERKGDKNSFARSILLWGIRHRMYRLSMMLLKLQSIREEKSR